MREIESERDLDVEKACDYSRTVQGIWYVNIWHFWGHEQSAEIQRYFGLIGVMSPVRELIKRNGLTTLLSAVFRCIASLKSPFPSLTDCLKHWLTDFLISKRYHHAVTLSWSYSMLRICGSIGRRSTFDDNSFDMRVHGTLDKSRRVECLFNTLLLTDNRCS